MKKCLIAYSMFVFFTRQISHAQNVGIGTTTAFEKLEVNGNIKADTLKTDAIKITPNAAKGKVLTSDASGNATWQPSIGLTLPYSKSQVATGGALLSINNTAVNSSSVAIQGISGTGKGGYFASTSGRALETSGKLKFAGNGETNGAVLTSDISGNAIWKTPEKMFFKASGFVKPFNVPTFQSKILTDWSNIDYDIGGNSIFNNSQGDLFVLVAGLYRISVKVHCLYDNPNGFSEYNLMAILINGSIKSRTFVPIPISDALANAIVIGVTATTVLKLNNQDKISFQFSKTGSGASTAQFTASLIGNTYNEFTVEKID